MVLGPVTYVKAGAPFYAAQANLTPAQVAKFSDRWLKRQRSPPARRHGCLRTTRLDGAGVRYHVE